MFLLTSTFITWDVENIVSVGCLIGAVLSCIILYFVKRWHRKDPDFLIKQEEREREYRKRIQEEKELEEYTDAMYADEDYEE